jgi:hypothetical protein
MPDLGSKCHPKLSGERVFDAVALFHLLKAKDDENFLLSPVMGHPLNPNPTKDECLIVKLHLARQNQLNEAKQHFHRITAAVKFNHWQHHTCDLCCHTVKDKDGRTEGPPC